MEKKENALVNKDFIWFCEDNKGGRNLLKSIQRIEGVIRKWN